MSAVIVGSPSSGQKVLRRADFSTERNGLETLNEIYTVRTADRNTLQPNFGILHSAFSTASTTFERMAIENFSFRELDGDLTEINVTYVGLTSSSGLPPALVRLIPTPDAGIFGPDAVIEVEFLTDRTEAQFVSGTGRTDVLQKIPIPAQINGTTLPPNPREPFYRDNAGVANYYFGYVQKALQCERRGIFLVAKKVYAEEDLSIVGTSTPNIPQN